MLSLGAKAQSLAINFASDAIGAPPRGFVFSALRQATPGTWEVRRSGTGTLRHLAHVADPNAHGFALAVLTADAPANLALSARIRFAEGERNGGLIWRYRDENNFYIVGINLARHQALLHRIMSGNRIQLDAASDINLDPAEWHNLTVTHRGSQIVVHLDGIPILSAKDQSLDGGHAGVWSAGTAETWFSELKIDGATELPK
jgi:hypothetical protein